MFFKVTRLSSPRNASSTCLVVTAVVAATTAVVAAHVDFDEISKKDFDQ